MCGGGGMVSWVSTCTWSSSPSGRRPNHGLSAHHDTQSVARGQERKDAHEGHPSSASVATLARRERGGGAKMMGRADPVPSSHLDNVDELLRFFHGPVDLVVVTGAQINHHVLRIRGGREQAE